MTVYYMGDVLGRFIINADNTLTEAEETPAPDPEFDLDAFLAWVQKYADQAGIGSEYAKAVEAIKAAASEKQVTISTVASVAQLLVFVVYLVYKKNENFVKKFSCNKIIFTSVFFWKKYVVGF